MISRYNVWMNDISLTEIDPAIYIADISYQAAKPSRSANRLAMADGQHSYGQDYFEESKTTVYFAVREYNTNKRQRIVQDIVTWAMNGGWLKTSDRIGQRIYVHTSQFPSVASALQWTDNLSVEFTAYDYPFWQDETANTIDLNSGDEGDLFVPGVRKTVVEAVIVPSEPMTGFAIECGDTFMGFSDLSIPADQPIKITYTDDHHILTIESNGESLLSNRTTDSDDDLALEPGMGYVYFDAETAAVCTLSVRGVYL